MFHGRITMFHELLEVFSRFCDVSCFWVSSAFHKTDRLRFLFRMPARRLPQGAQLVGRRLARHRRRRCCQCQQPTLDGLSDCACGWPLPSSPRTALPIMPMRSSSGEYPCRARHDEAGRRRCHQAPRFHRGRHIVIGACKDQLGPPVLPPRWVPRLLNRHVGQHQMHRVFLRPRNQRS